MQFIGFKLNKISGYKKPEFKATNTNIDINFTDIKEENLSVIKDKSIKVNFRFIIKYKEENSEKIIGEILFEGEIILDTTEDEKENILKAWETKKLPSNFRVPLFNIILQKCSIRALSMEEDLQLPTHVPLPVLKPQKPEERENKE